MSKGKGKGGPPGHDEVGYGNPPLHSRYPPGTSGNLKGRPPGARGKHKQQDAILQRAREIFLEESDRKITVREGDKRVTMDAYRLAVRANHISAVKGGQMAQRHVIQTRLALEAEFAQIMSAAFSGAVLYKEECELKRQQCHREGRPVPRFLPDPDDIVIDWETLTVSFEGPVTSEQQAQLDERKKLRGAHMEDFEYIRKRYENEGRSEAGLWNALISQRMFDLLNESLPERHRKDLKNRFPDPDLDRLKRKKGRKTR